VISSPNFHRLFASIATKTFWARFIHHELEMLPILENTTHLAGAHDIFSLELSHAHEMTFIKKTRVAGNSNFISQGDLLTDYSD
jgi:hypothetical protein